MYRKTSCPACGTELNIEVKVSIKDHENEPDLDINAPNLQYTTEGLDSVPDEKARC